MPDEITIKCTERGWKTLAVRFRHYVNCETEPKPDGADGSPIGPWGDTRCEAARKFARENNLSKSTFDELIMHVPIYQMSGRRDCMRCFGT